MSTNIESDKKKKVGLAFSGGGYRAAAYHIGTLRALNRLGILKSVDIISSVSGGSITAAYYALNKDNFEEFEKSLIEKLQKGVLFLALINLIVVFALIAFSIWLFGWWLLLVEIIVLFIFWYRIFPFSFWIEKAYNKVFFKKACMSDFPSKPLIAINSTDVSTGTLFTFSQKKMSGYKYKNSSKEKTFKHENFPISKAVMASSCVPFAFSPVAINKKYYNSFDKGEKKPLLIDGGLYDNQGAHKLTEKYSDYHTQYIIVSDAGVGEMNSKWAFNIPLMLVKTSNIMMRRIKTFQIRNNIYSSSNPELSFAYLSLEWDVSDRPIYGFVRNIVDGHISPELIAYHNLKSVDLNELKNTNKDISYAAQIRIVEQLKQNIRWSILEKVMPTQEEHKTAKSVGTNLTALGKDKINALIKHSNWLAEVQIRLYLPHLIQDN